MGILISYRPRDGNGSREIIGGLVKPSQEGPWEPRTEKEDWRSGRTGRLCMCSEVKQTGLPFMFNVSERKKSRVNGRFGAK